jgi:hypothetical protein
MVSMKFFESSHLPDKLKGVSSEIERVAQTMNKKIEDNPEKSAGMRKLLEAKDCFVRAKLAEGWLRDES